ncbi:unnamed protein product [Echinostoma caproni]|uniref:Transposase n=1 Tax=Echinostoma caproni TaxID=27848 RepID=A0A183AP10_9TREM|nr:unnamed protein product [Echinostoma caproni]
MEDVKSYELKKPYSFTKAEVRRRVIECALRVGDLKEATKHLDMKIKTCRAIGATNGEFTLKPGSYEVKLNDEFTKYFCGGVDDNPTATLRQLKERIKKDFAGTSISNTSIVRLLDGHHYLVKKLTVQPAERNSETVMVKLAEYTEAVC